MRPIVAIRLHLYRPMANYQTFKTTMHYHSAIYTLLHEIERQILADYVHDMDLDYLKQCVSDAIAADGALYLEQSREDSV